jgi:hypothetical protein
MVGDCTEDPKDSWVESGEDWIKYEDLLENDAVLLGRALIDRCGLEISRDRFREAVCSCRFDKLSSGRPAELKTPIPICGKVFRATGGIISRRDEARVQTQCPDWIWLRA